MQASQTERRHAETMTFCRLLLAGGSWQILGPSQHKLVTPSPSSLRTRGVASLPQRCAAFIVSFFSALRLLSYIYITLGTVITSPVVGALTWSRAIGALSLLSVRYVPCCLSILSISVRALMSPSVCV